MCARHHLHDELAANVERVRVGTAFGPVTGGRAANGAAIFLGALAPAFHSEILHRLTH
jgi:hypothetical protein